MQVRPLFDRILIKRLDSASKTAGGLFIPESAHEKPSEGEVLAIGTGRLGEDGALLPLAVNVGDVVAFGKYAGTQIKVDGEDRLVLRESEIFGIIEN